MEDRFFAQVRPPARRRPAPGPSRPPEPALPAAPSEAARPITRPSVAVARVTQSEQAPWSGPRAAFRRLSNKQAGRLQPDPPRLSGSFAARQPASAGFVLL